MPNTVDVRGTTVSYAVDGAGPALVLVAGTGGNLESNWAHLVPGFAQSHTVLRADYSGSGDTTDPEGPLELDLLADQIVAAARAANALPFDLLGFSLGACVSIQIAATYPELVRSLVLLAGFPTGQDTRMGLQARFWQQLIHRDPHLFAQMILLTGLSPGFVSAMDDATLRQWLDAIIVSNRWEGITRQIDLDARLDVRPLLSRVQAPTLVLACTQDQMVPRSHSQALAQGIANARYAELDSGHLAPFEQADVLLREVLAFIAPR